MAVEVMVGLDSPSLRVVEGNTFSVCVYAMADSQEPFTERVEAVLQFFTADTGDLTPARNIPPVMLSDSRPYGCFNFQALQNNDGSRFSETFALSPKQSNSFIVPNQLDKTYITILENAPLDRISVPRVVDTSEGNTAVACVHLNSTEPIVVNLKVQDIDTGKSTMNDYFYYVDLHRQSHV